MGAAACLAAMSASVNQRPPAKPRAPLPPFPPGVYDHTFPVNQIVPPNPAKRWPRANWFSVEVPGLPWVEGQSSEHPEMVLSYFLHKYTIDWQQKIMFAHAIRGYSHFMMSWSNARQDGVSLPDFVAMCQRLKAYGFIVHVMLAGKDTDPHDSDWSVLGPILSPCLQALIAARAVDMVSMWETNLWNIPGAPLESILNGLHAICQPAGVDQWVHFSTEVVWWGTTNRAYWWQQQIGVLTGILYQGDVSWDMPLRQAHMADTTNKPSAAPLFADGTFLFCAAEMDGMNIYNPTFSEDIGDMRGYLHLCTNGLTPVSGFCNGARYPNGAVI